MTYIFIKRFILIIALFIGCRTQAQNKPYNPYERFEKDVKVLTLSNGKYDEFFDTDSIEIIGSAVLNTNTMQVIGFVELDTIYSEATLEPEVISRWLSLDPMAAKYPSLSPYNFTSNNPILLIDPDGGDNVIYLVALPSAQEKLSKADIADIAAKTNEHFKQLGVNTRVVVFDAETHGDFDANNLDHNDSFALLGSNDEFSTFANDNPGTVVKEAREGKLNTNFPEVSDKGSGAVTGQGIFINLGANEVFSKKFFNLSGTDAVAWTILHGSTHNSGLSHSDAFGINSSGTRQASILNPDVFGNGTGVGDNGEIIYPSDNPGTTDDIIQNTQQKVIDFNVRTFGRGVGDNGAVSVDNYARNKSKNAGVKKSATNNAKAAVRAAPRASFEPSR